MADLTLTELPLYPELIHAVIHTTCCTGFTIVHYILVTVHYTLLNVHRSLYTKAKSLVFKACLKLGKLQRKT